MSHNVWPQPTPGFSTRLPIDPVAGAARPDATLRVTRARPLRPLFRDIIRHDEREAVWRNLCSIGDRDSFCHLEAMISLEVGATQQGPVLLIKLEVEMPVASGWQRIARPAARAKRLVSIVRASTERP